MAIPPTAGGAFVAISQPRRPTRDGVRTIGWYSSRSCRVMSPPRSVLARASAAPRSPWYNSISALSCHVDQALRQRPVRCDLIDTARRSVRSMMDLRRFRIPAVDHIVGVVEVGSSSPARRGSPRATARWSGQELGPRDRSETSGGNIEACERSRRGDTPPPDDRLHPAPYSM